MSTHLLPVGTPNPVPIKYRQYLPACTVTSAISCERNRILYIGVLFDSTTFRIMTLNLMTNVIGTLGDVQTTTAFASGKPDGMVATDDCIYVMASRNTALLYRIEQDTLQITTINLESYVSAYNNMVIDPLDRDTIIFCLANGFLLYDTTTGTQSQCSVSTNVTRNSFAIGQRLMVSVPTGSTNQVAIYDRSDQTASVVTLANSGITTCCYGDGKFYFVQPNRFYVMDELTKTVDEAYIMPITYPNKAAYTNGYLFVTQSGYSDMYIYDTIHQVYERIFCPWPVPATTNTTLLQPSTFNGYYFIPFQTLGIMRCMGTGKYRLGYKYDQRAFIMNDNTQNTYEWDDRFVTFNASFMTVHNGDLEYEAIPDETIENVKRIPLSKSDYRKILNLTFHSTEEEVIT